MRKLELLAPAKNLETGIEAIKHGADAVYIGGPSFGARAAAGNSVEEIAELCSYAHFYGAKVYVTFNTIIYDNELHQAQELIYQLYDAGVDALIVQDLALCTMQLPPIELHASTQLDITKAEKAIFLEQAGFKQIVLARELSLNQIKEIRQATNCELEAFIHGALCVSYSGRCYASEFCFNRSANRGQCAQFCRLPFTLKDSNGKTIRKDKHLLSLRDMNRSAYIEELIDAGINSFKIEGRLKDIKYVKNVTAYYRTIIDNIITKRSNEFKRSSYGQTHLKFTPQLDKSFNRKFTEYFLHNERNHEANIDTPKSMGENIGLIRKVWKNKLEIIIHEGLNIQPGDGLCYIDHEGKLQGFRANTVTSTNERNKLIVTTFGKSNNSFTGNHPLELYRNLDIQFESALEKESATRKLLLKLELEETPNGFILLGIDEMGRQASELITIDHQPSKTYQQENILRQLMKIGDSQYAIENIEIKFSQDWFIPSSLLSTARRNLIRSLSEIKNKNSNHNQTPPPIPHTKNQFIKQKFDYTANIANHRARQYYENHGATSCDPAFEIERPQGRTAIMFCKYCIRHELGICKKTVSNFNKELKEPLTLYSADGKKFDLSFDCKNCEMSVWTHIE